MKQNTKLCPYTHCNSWLPNTRVTRVAIETGTNDFELNNLAIVNVQLFLTHLFHKVTIQKGAFVQVTQRGVVARYNRLQLKGTMWDL